MVLLLPNTSFPRRQAQVIMQMSFKKIIVKFGIRIKLLTVITCKKFIENFLHNVLVYVQYYNGNNVKFGSAYQVIPDPKETYEGSIREE